MPRSPPVGGRTGSADGPAMNGALPPRRSGSPRMSGSRGLSISAPRRARRPNARALILTRSPPGFRNDFCQLLQGYGPDWRSALSQGAVAWRGPHAGAFDHRLYRGAVAGTIRRRRQHHPAAHRRGDMAGRSARRCIALADDRVVGVSDGARGLGDHLDVSRRRGAGGGRQALSVSATGGERALRRGAARHDQFPRRHRRGQYAGAHSLRDFYALCAIHLLGAERLSSWYGVFHAGGDPSRRADRGQGAAPYKPDDDLAGRGVDGIATIAADRKPADPDHGCGDLHSYLPRYSDAAPGPIRLNMSISSSVITPDRIVPPIMIQSTNAMPVVIQAFFFR